MRPRFPDDLFTHQYPTYQMILFFVGIVDLIAATYFLVHGQGALGFLFLAVGVFMMGGPILSCFFPVLDLPVRYATTFNLAFPLGIFVLSAWFGSPATAGMGVLTLVVFLARFYAGRHSQA